MSDSYKQPLLEKFAFWLMDFSEKFETKGLKATDKAFDKIEKDIDNLFENKICDVCGDKIKIFGKRKILDGKICKKCDDKLSPFFCDRRQSKLEQIKEQLNYRESNKAAVSAFNVTRTLNGGTVKILIDEDAGKFIISSSRKWRNENPDVIKLSQVTGCTNDVDEIRKEIYQKDKNGNKTSYKPPRYKYYYDFKMIIYVNSPWFDEITFLVNDGIMPVYRGGEYKDTEKKAQEIKEALIQKGVIL